MCFIEDYPLRMRQLKISCLHEVKTPSGLYGAGLVASTVYSLPEVSGEFSCAQHLCQYYGGFRVHSIYEVGREYDSLLRWPAANWT